MVWRPDASNKIDYMRRNAIFLAGLSLIAGCGGNQTNSNSMGGTNYSNSSSNRDSAAANSTLEFLTKGAGAKAIAGSNEFGLRLLEQLSASGDENVLVSPAALTEVLALAYQGAGGETRNGLAKALQLEKVKPDQISQTIKGLGESLRADGDKVELAIANSLWMDPESPAKSDFLKANRMYYQAHVAEAKPGDKSAAEQISKWVGQKTGGRIKIIDNGPSSGATGMTLVSAVAFRGTWKQPFDSTKTQSADFTIAAGNKASVSMMTIRGKFDYLKTDALEAIRLPYADGRTSLYVLLPAGDPAALLKEISAEKWGQWRDDFKEIEAEVSIPKLKLDYGIDLKDKLAALGMTAAFDPSADFSAISAKKPFVGSVMHRTAFQTDDEPMETVGTPDPGAGSDAKQALGFVANRPFVYLVVDGPTRSLLLAGVFRKPQGP